MRARPLQVLALALPMALLTPADPGDALTHEPIVAGVRVFYGPDAQLEQIDAGLIASARQTIDMAAYVLTNRVIINALREAARRGARVRLYLDPDQRRDRRPDPMSALALLFAAFAPLEHEVAGRAHRGRRAACARPLPGEQFFERLRRALPALAGV